jgi:hypothetical protein
MVQLLPLVPGWPLLEGMLREQVSLQYGSCDRCCRANPWVRIAGLTGFWISIALMLHGFREMQTFALLGSAGGLVLFGAMLLRRERRITASHITDDTIWLKGVAPSLLERFPESSETSSSAGGRRG